TACLLFAGCAGPNATAEMEALETIEELWTQRATVSDGIVAKATIQPPEARVRYEVGATGIDQQFAKILDGLRKLIVARGKVDWKILAERAKNLIREARK
ncbi:MAG: hypothetical protein ACPGVY_15080, partial [Mycobacterium sp.]